VAQDYDAMTVSRVAANPSGMGERLPEFNSISRLPPDVAREMIISRNALNLVLDLYNGRKFG